MNLSPMPAAFLGHGSPINALERNRYTEAWRDPADAQAPDRAHAPSDLGAHVAQLPVAHVLDGDA